MNGPKVYAELSSVAKDFLAKEYRAERPKFVPPYEYLGAGANLSKMTEAVEPDIHKFLSQSAPAKVVAKEFGNIIDTLA